MDYDEAEAYGLELTPEQKQMVEWRSGYALIGQVIPVPNCCERSRTAIGACKHDDHIKKRVIIPTVLEVASIEAQAEAEGHLAKHEARMKEIGYIREDEVTQLPGLYGHVLDMTETALDWGCGCALTGEISCDCDGDGRGQFFSPYAAVPISQETAIAVMQAASQGLGAGSYYPLYELVNLQNHGLDAIGDDIDYDDIPEVMSEAYDQLLEKYEAPLLDHIRGDGPERCGPYGQIHIDRKLLTYEVPEEVKPEALAVQENQKRLLRQYKSLFKRTPRTLRAEADRVFAYPCND